MRLNRLTIARLSALILLLAVTTIGLWLNSRGTAEAADIRSDPSISSPINARDVKTGFDESGNKKPDPQEAQSQNNDPEANLPYLFSVFIITWALFFGYAFVMSRRQNEMRGEIESLRRSLAERDDPENPS